MRKLDIGPGGAPIQEEGWDTLDIVGNPTVKADLSKPLPIEDNTYDLINLSHVLEHLPWFLAIDVLKELYRILKPEGTLEVWVPDFDKLVYIYLHQKDYLDFPKPMLYSKFNPDHLVMATLNYRLFAGCKGTQENVEEAWHRACFNYEYLGYCLNKAGFKDIKRIYTPRGYDHGFINLGMSGAKRIDCRERKYENISI